MRSELVFDRPAEAEATAPPEARGLARDEVRLLVSTSAGHRDASFRELPDFLEPGTLLVANRSSMLAASMPARGVNGTFMLNLATRFADDLWLAEPRWDSATPGPLPVTEDERISVAGVPASIGPEFPDAPRLRFVRFAGDIDAALVRRGSPIRYGYLEPPFPALDAYQTIFGDTPGSAEMPSASRPFTPRVLAALERRGIELAKVTLHTGVSSLEVTEDRIESHPVPPEPFEVSAEAADAVERARAEGRRVVAIGTTAVRALESAWDGRRVRAASGFTRLVVHPGRGVNVVGGLITGLHDPLTSHLAMLHAIAGAEMVRGAYLAAVAGGYRWHEFGDSHLLLP